MGPQYLHARRRHPCRLPASAVGSSHADHDAMAGPIDGVLHFTGKATCGQGPAAVHGALHSGHRPAEHIHGSPWPN
ncbi:FAD-dependent oxidoreductase [Streptomyces sp. NPDC001914]|uniref:FAD-dependent oxidoreductase n=1 Tax=Streptomyces sp. NPDC001914 TaxID=3364623 RepID=UPI0036B659C1